MVEMEYKIRLAKKEDCKSIAKVKHDVWNSTYRGIYSDELIDTFDLDEHAASFLKLIEDEDINLYVLDCNGKIVGYMSVGKPRYQFEDYEAEIGLLYVKEEYQAMGLGKKLFQKGYKDLKHQGYKKFFISCNKYNERAQKFYEHMGGIIIHIDEDDIDKRKPQVKFHYDIKEG